MKAFRVTVNDLGPAVVFAETRSRAKYLGVAAYRDAYESRRGEWPSVHALRAPEYDLLANREDVRQQRTKAFCEDYVQGLLR